MSGRGGARTFAVMTTTTLLPRAAAVLAAGGLAWLAKMAVITATDGAVADGATAAGVFYLLGVVLMPAGLAGVAVALTAGRHGAIRGAAAVGGLFSFFVLFVALEGVAKGLVGDAGPSWLQDEAGILVTGAVLMGGGLLAARSAPAAT
jgi:hypothetical protein